ncbi:glutamine synthetase [Catellatospora sp. IY07-71]|uniref:glutamine synthetase family protein n=1 Tax=Catellatospora sp. IY07-71 TaxID=2728827 RepID=UPI001BB3FB6C|nr:glutamine synthetase family protein [Catellatospora sp. IY07-71]BCJ77534.1 glutamine synthetase [Catellatospora sp. IY07-71]
MWEPVLDRDARAAAARAAAAELAAVGVHGVALTWVDNTGVTRVKAVPTGRLEHAAAWGVGMSKVHDVFCVDDSITAGDLIGGPVGDLRLHPDLGALTVLAAAPGWAWAPVDRWTQDGEPYPPDQRLFAQRLVERARAAGLTFRMAFEIEWYLGRPDGSPAADGPAYGMTRLTQLADFGRDLLAALAAQAVPVEQFHPEYGHSQFELSTAAADPVGAADRVVLVRETIRALALSHGLRASFAPVSVAEHVGNGMHLHFSPWAGGANLLAGGDGPYGMTRRGESVLAGVLDRLPALAGLGAPSWGSALRQAPQRWAGAYQCWGHENREAGLRFVTGAAGAREQTANAEVKCVDGSANPYLVVGAVCALAADAADTGLRLPAEVTADPFTLAEDRRPPRLPDTPALAADALHADAGLCAALGEGLLDAFTAVHRTEADTLGRLDPEHLVETVRWRY